MTWEKELAVKAEMVNVALDQLLPPASQDPSSIHEAMRYSIFAGGKRLRGAFVLAAAGVLGMEERCVLPAAAAMEMLHTYSLIHDDLPAMDNDDYRRGKPSCHKAFGEAIAILAGDALLTRAFEALGALLTVGVAPDTVVRVVAEVSMAAGTGGLIGGQVVDLESEGREIQPATLAFIHRNKTGALFRAAVRCGAILAGAGKRELDVLTDYAAAFGLAFQITDDILDLTGDAALLGKPIKSDLANRKATYPGCFGISRARELAEAQGRIALQNLTFFGAKAGFLREAVFYLLRRES